MKTQEQKREYARAWYLKNKDRTRGYQAKRKLANPERFREQTRRAGKKFRDAHPEKTRESWKRYQDAHPAERLEQIRRHREKYPARHLLQYTRTRAARLKREFTLTEEWVADRLEGGCEISGARFDLSRVIPGGQRRIRGPSIDRIDCAKGYTPENSRLICVGINLGMQEWGLKETSDLWRAVLARSE